MDKDVRALGHLKFACIGPVTKERLKDFGIISDILPETYRAESVIDAFSTVEIKDKKVSLFLWAEKKAFLENTLNFRSYTKLR